MGFYKHNIDQTNFGLIWKVELFLKPKVFTGTPISIVKLDLPILPYMGTNMGMLPPSISFSISNNLILTSFIFTFKLNINFNFTFELRNKNKKNNVFFGGQKKQKKTRFFFKKNDSFFLIYNTSQDLVDWQKLRAQKVQTKTDLYAILKQTEIRTIRPFARA